MWLCLRGLFWLITQAVAHPADKQYSGNFIFKDDVKRQTEGSLVKSLNTCMMYV